MAREIIDREVLLDKDMIQQHDHFIPFPNTHIKKSAMAVVVAVAAVINYTYLLNITAYRCEEGRGLLLCFEAG